MFRISAGRGRSTNGPALSPGQGFTGPAGTARMLAWYQEAEVAEPVDAKVSKTFFLTEVRVRVPPSALAVPRVVP